MSENQTALPIIKKPVHYVDNVKFLAALVEYRLKVDESKAKGEELPRVTNYIGECFMKISTHLSYARNFINYSYKDEMISDAIENCLTCVSNFDQEKSKNPFAYFTQVCFYAFVRRIQKEQKQTLTKYKILENMDIDSIVAQEHDSGEFNTQFFEYIRKQMEFLDTHKKLATAKKKKPIVDDTVAEE